MLKNMKTYLLLSSDLHFMQGTKVHIHLAILEFSIIIPISFNDKHIKVLIGKYLIIRKIKNFKFRKSIYLENADILNQ